MKKTLTLIGLILLLVSCSQKEGDYYFDFDKVEHYSIEINENNLSKKEKLQIELILDDKPESIRDTIFIEKLEGVGFIKKPIDESKIESIKEIFREKSHKETYALACIAVFRDFLIFKKDKKIIGMAKICFDCSQNRILGANINTMKFGQSGDYGKLAKILNKKSR